MQWEEGMFRFFFKAQRVVPRNVGSDNAITECVVVARNERDAISKVYEALDLPPRYITLVRLEEINEA